MTSDKSGIDSLNKIKRFLLLATLSGATAVCIGAFGAHSLKSVLSDSAMSAYQTAVQYQFVHSLMLVAISLLMKMFGESKALLTSASLFSLGLVLFCGSLYGLALGGPAWLGPITPFGGVCFIAAWLSAAWGAFRL